MKQKQKNELKKKAEIKLEKIRSVESNFNEKKKKQEQKMRKKLETIAKRIAILKQEKEAAQLDTARKAQEKMKKLQEIRTQIKLVRLFFLSYLCSLNFFFIIQNELSFCEDQKNKLDSRCIF